MSEANRRKLAAALCLTLMAILLPAALLGWLLRLVGGIIDLVGQGVNHIVLGLYHPFEDVVETKLGVDADRDHEAWCMRMYEDRMERERLNGNVDLTV